MPGRGSPLRECTVGAAIHAYAAVAPRLLGDPVDDRPGIIAVVPEWHDLGPAAPLAAREGDDSDVAVSGTLLGKSPGIHIDRELQQCRKPLRIVFRTNDHRGDIG